MKPIDTLSDVASQRTGWDEGTGEGDGIRVQPPLKHRLRRMLLAGLLILVPAAAALFVLSILFEALDRLFGPAVDRTLSHFLPEVSIPGLRVVMVLTVVVLVLIVLGWLSTNVVGRRLIGQGELVVARVPVLGTIYSATKGVLETLSREQAAAFTRVILVEYPKKDVFVLGFVTRTAQWEGVDPRTADLLLVFVPTTPNPTSGFLLLVPRAEAISLPIGVEEGIRMVISGGLLMPENPALHGLPGPTVVSAAPPAEPLAR